MGWSDDHLHQFRIHGKRYGISRIGGVSFSDDPNTVRLLDEAKGLLESMQHTIVEQQVTEFLKQLARCPGCGLKRRRKGRHNPIVYRTLFGKLRLISERFYHCRCQPHTHHTFSPLAQLLTERSSPELLYLETKFASLMS